MKGSRFAAVVFDLDGTLVEIDNVKEHADDVLKRTLSRFGVTGSDFNDRYMFFFSGIGFLALLEKWGITTQDQKRSFLEALSREECAEKRMLMEQGSARLYKDTAILDALKGRIKMGLVTNSSGRATQLELGRFNIKRYFDSVVSLGDFADHLAPKPAPDGIVRCLERLNKHPSKALVVGDNLSDVIAGERSGARTALILRGGHSALRVRRGVAPRIDFKLRTLNELDAILR